MLYILFYVHVHTWSGHRVHDHSSKTNVVQYIIKFDYVCTYCYHNIICKINTIKSF